MCGKNALVEDIVRVSNQYRNIHLACVDLGGLRKIKKENISGMEDLTKG